jgi:hypothetical protein
MSTKTTKKRMGRDLPQNTKSFLENSNKSPRFSYSFSGQIPTLEEALK